MFVKAVSAQCPKLFLVTCTSQRRCPAHPAEVVNIQANFGTLPGSYPTAAFRCLADQAPLDDVDQRAVYRGKPRRTACCDLCLVASTGEFCAAWTASPELKGCSNGSVMELKCFLALCDRLAFNHCTLSRAACWSGCFMQTFLQSAKRLPSFQTRW